MRRFWIGIGLLGVFLLAGLWLGSRMHRIHTPIAEALTRAEERAEGGDWAQAERLTRDARDQWEQHRDFSAAFCNHQPMDEIDARFRRLEIYLARQQETAYRAECLYLSERLEDLAESFRLKWWNLL